MMSCFDRIYDLNLELKQLVAKTCKTSGLERQQALAELYILVTKSRKLLRKNTSYYQDALQETWEYICTYPEEYQPNLHQVITWINDELKKKLNKHKMRSQRQNKRHLNPWQTTEGEVLDPIDNLVSPKDIEPVLHMWETIREWVRLDPDGILSSIYFRKYPHINARSVIEKRLPFNVDDWKNITRQWNLNPKEAQDLPKFYSRKCKPLLIQFAKTQGYI